VKRSSRRQAAQRGIALPDLAARDAEEPATEQSTAPATVSVSDQPNRQAAYIAPEAAARPQAKPAPAKSPEISREDKSTQITRLPKTEKKSPQQDPAIIGPAGTGSVARVNADSGTVEVKFSRGSQLQPGMKLSVTHGYLLKHENIGQLEVVAVGSSMVTARPVGDCPIAKIARGDAVSVLEAKTVAAAKPGKAEVATGSSNDRPVWVSDLLPTRR
jgi:hypothetical protein